MPTHTREVAVTADQQTAWDFVRLIRNWASLFPGYQRHLEVDQDNFVWHIRGEAGVWSRVVEFDVHVPKWNPPDEIMFQIEGRSEPVGGTGRFYLRPNGEHATTMGFELSLGARGPTAPMLNALVEKFVTNESGRFLDRLAEEIGRSSRSGTGKPATDRPPSEYPTGPGAIVVHYQAPRSREFEAWLHGPHYDDLLGQPGVVRVSRFERIGTDEPLGSYLALIYSRDLATTMRFRTTAGLGEQKAADARGLVRGESYLARVVYDRRTPLIQRLSSWWRRS